MNYILALTLRSSVITFLLTTSILAKVDPLSKIIITSQEAVCTKNAQLLNINYKKNVFVTLADNSTIKSHNLEVNLENSLTKNLSFKQAVFSGSVKIIKDNRSILADIVTVNLKDKTCLLSGNVTIEQLKNNKDLPLITKSNSALLDLNTQKITLNGNKETPVSTTIIIEDLSILKK